MSFQAVNSAALLQNNDQQIIQIDARARQKLDWPAPITLPEWADRHRQLSRSAGAVGGLWQTSRVEVARGPMLAVTERGVRTITLEVATQLLKTEVLLNTIGFLAHIDPGPMLMVLPKDAAAVRVVAKPNPPRARGHPHLWMSGRLA